MPFKKGQKKIGGRTRGTPNKLRFTGESRAWWRQYLESERFREKMVALIERGDANPVLVWMLNSLYGRPKVAIEATGDKTNTNALVLFLPRNGREVELPAGQSASERARAAPRGAISADPAGPPVRPTVIRMLSTRKAS
jgi:hypothetical protein